MLRRKNICGRRQEPTCPSENTYASSAHGMIMRRIKSLLMPTVSLLTAISLLIAVNAGSGIKAFADLKGFPSLGGGSFKTMFSTFPLERPYGQIPSIDVGSAHVVGLLDNGTVVAAGSNSYGQLNVGDWRDIVAVSAGDYHTVGLRSDGSVIAVGNNDCGQCSVSAWRNIISISAGCGCTFGLRADGTVVSVGSNEWFERNVDSWSNIKSIESPWRYTVGLCRDGRVLATDGGDSWSSTVSTWRDMTAISAGPGCLLGLRSDGTVVAAVEDKLVYDYYFEEGAHGEPDEFWYDIVLPACEKRGVFPEYNDIVAIAADGSHALGLRSNGRVVAVGCDDSGAGKVSSWKKIITVKTGMTCSLGLCSDGTAVVAGGTNEIRKAVSSWKNLMVTAQEVSPPEEYVWDSYVYSPLPDGSICIVRYTGTDVNVSIPGKINGFTVTAIGDRAFAENNYIESLVIPDSVRTIGDAAFFSCWRLHELILPSGLEVIPSCAFALCSLRALDIPHGIKVIGDNAFASNPIGGLLIIPDSVVYIGSEAFWDSQLSSVLIPDSVSFIGQYAFGKEFDYYSTPVIIYGYPGSCAEEYAIANDLTFINISANSGIAPSAPGSAGSGAQSGDPVPPATDPSLRTAPFYGIWCSATKDRDGAYKKANELISNGFDGMVFVTTDWSNLNSEMWYVITAGIYETKEDAQACLADVQWVYPKAYIKYSGSRIG